MNKKNLILLYILIAESTLLFYSSKTYGAFQTQADLVNNIFATAEEFSTPTPVATVTEIPTFTPTSIPQVSPSSTPIPTITSLPTLAYGCKYDRTTISPAPTEPSAEIPELAVKSNTLNNLSLWSDLHPLPTLQPLPKLQPLPQLPMIVCDFAPLPSLPSLPVLPTLPQLSPLPTLSAFVTIEVPSLTPSYTPTKSSLTPIGIQESPTPIPTEILTPKPII